MAYTIISQNNSTTTLSDGVNTITVPSRVNLTSGNFTIVEVNNNMATLEDGDGNVYRDIPCVATLAGEGGGGSSYTAGTGIDITSGVISVTAPTLQNTATGGNAVCIKGDQASGVSAIAIGNYSKANNAYTISIGSNAGYNAAGRTINIGESARATAVNAMQFGSGTNTEAGTVCFALTNTVGGVPTNYKLLSADSTIPTARLTKVNTTITLAAADWSAGTQTVTVNGITATSVVWVSPDPSDQADYVAGGILCTAQAANSLTFTASTTPTNDIDVVVVAM